MKIANDFKPELCAATERGRYCIQNTYLDGNHIIATDGRCLTVVPVMLERNDANGLIQPEAFKEARALAKKSWRKASKYGMEANGAVKLDNGATYPRPNEGVFPKWRQVIPRETPTITIGLSALYLAEIATVIGAGKGTDSDGMVFIDIIDGKKPYVIHRGDRTKGAYAVLMPINPKEDAKTPDYYGADEDKAIQESWTEALSENTRIEFDSIIPAAAKSARFERDWNEANQIDFDLWAKTRSKDNVSAAIYSAHMEACAMDELFYTAKQYAMDAGNIIVVSAPAPVAAIKTDKPAPVTPRRNNPAPAPNAIAF